MSSEILRRLKNNSVLLGKETHEEVRRKFIVELCAMGYSREWREGVLESSVNGYMRVLRKVSNGEGQRHREGYKTAFHRRYKKLCGTTEWYEDKE